jgi:DNA excision repair protein ERCC-2
MTEITVSVRDLVSFMHRAGDLDHRFSPSPTAEQGIEGHRRVYRRRPDSYRQEYPVSYRHSDGATELLLRGRADGFDPEARVVEEIKTCRVPANRIPESVSRLHLAQARIYAALIALERDLAGLEVRLTWFNIDSGEENSLSQHYSRSELLVFLEDSLQQFSDWLQLLAQRRRARDESLAPLDFPYGRFRPGQREIAELVYKCIDQGGQLMVEAPTGLGKTAAVLYPALKALATGKHERIVFATAKTVGRLAAEDTLGTFAAAGMVAPALSLTAAERICFSPGKACNGDDCPFARGYYDRRREALEQAIQSPSLCRSDIERVARSFEICPYQLSLDLLPWVDMVIADVHYLYSLTAILSGMMAQDGLRWSVLLDEAHNLPGRARRMFGATLAKRDLMAAIRVASGTPGKSLKRINRVLLELQKEPWAEQEFDSRPDPDGALLRAIQAFASEVGDALADEPALLARQPTLAEFYFDALQFLRAADNWGDEFRFELHRGEGRQGLMVVLNCLDPGRLLEERQGRLHAVTVFSATLSPPDWMRSALGLDAQAVYRRHPSPFASEQLEVCLATGIDTRYRQREASMGALAEAILDWLRAEPGNCLVYFPSYRYLESCLQRLRAIGLETLDRVLWVQKRDQGDAGREALLTLLAEQRRVAAFCILGGVFGEGIDLPGERLTSVVIVGVGMPQYNRDNEQLRHYFQQSAGSGFEYAYLYPGMQKVDQALGRVVRRDGDRGRALLIDRRYAEPRYRELLPPWWSYRRVPEDIPSARSVSDPAQAANFSSKSGDLGISGIVYETPQGDSAAE